MDDARATKDAAFLTPAASPAQGAARRRAALRLAARERRRETQLLAEALDENRLKLTHAPRWRLADGSLAAEEVSLHWPRADLSVAAALSATSHGAVARRIRRWMLERACAPDACGAQVVSVPVAGVMLGGDLADCVFAALAPTGLAPERLELRLPEGSLLQPSTEVLLALSALRDRGVRLALEDFGMRYGSATMLRNLPLNVVQLDPSLTHELDDGGEDTRLAAGLIGMAHALHLRVVARAVDSPERLAALLGLGVDEGTGRLLDGVNRGKASAQGTAYVRPVGERQAADAAGMGSLGGGDLGRMHH